MTTNLASNKKYYFSESYRAIFEGKVQGVIIESIYNAFVPKKDEPEILEIIFSPYAINDMGLMNEATKRYVVEIV